MPCYDDRTSPNSVRAKALEEFRHNSPVAELLCEAMQILAIRDMETLCSSELLKWWEEHQDRDKSRGRT